MPLALSLVSLTACTDPAPTPGSESESESGSESGSEPLECDVPQLFVDRCGGEGCHSAGGSTAASLDLASPGVEDRVSGAPGKSCAGTLADPSSPESSLLYVKVSDTPGCGSRMPIGGETLTEDEMLCLRDWISGLLPPGPDTDSADTTDTDDCPGCECEPGIEESCYTGPSDTVDVGICLGGTRVCADDGLSWGPCEGETKPQGENCLTPDIDEDCDGQTPECGELWSRSFGDELSQTIRSAVVDAEGSVYSFGDFEGVVSFGGEPLVAEGDKADLVLAKHDLYGNPVWSKRYGDSSNQYGAKILIDQNGDLILLGRIFGNVDFGDGGMLSAEGAGDIILVKLDADGNHIWSRIYGDLDPDRAERLALDSQGNVVFTGTFTGAVDYGSGQFVSAGMRDAFVAKVDGQTGAHEFAVQIGGTGDDYGFGIDVDADDNVVVAGRFQDTIDIGVPLMSAGGTDLYVAKLDPNGAPLWAESFGGSGEDGVHDLAVQGQTGDIVLLGAMADTVSFGGPDLISAGERDIFVATLDQAGAHVWSANYGDAADQFTHTFEVNTWMTLELGPDGSIYIGGSLMGVANFGGADIMSSGENPDVFFVQLGADGSLISNRRYGGTGTDIALDLSLSPAGHIVLAGRSFGTSLDFGISGMVALYGSADGFIATIDP